jgi:hypothetical protein
MLYEILLDAPHSTLDKSKENYGPHIESIVGLTQRNSTDLLSNQLQKLSNQQTMSIQTPSSTTSITHMSDVDDVKSTNPKDNQKK